MPTGKFAISGLRVFGKGSGEKPDTVRQFIVLRSENDSRNALIKWFTVNNATGYNIYWGVAPDKLYNNVMVYNDNQYYFKPMDKGRTYYFSIEAFNENGVSEKIKPIQVMATEEAALNCPCSVKKASPEKNISTIIYMKKILKFLPLLIGIFISSHCLAQPFADEIKEFKKQDGKLIRLRPMPFSLLAVHHLENGRM